MKDKVEKNLYDILGQEIDVPNSFSNAISNFEYKKKKRIKVNIYRKVAIAFSFILVSMNMVGYAFRITDIFKAESTVGYVDNSMQQAVENGYIQNVEMDYLYSNNVGAKIDYVIMSDYNLNILFNFDVSMKKNMQNTLADIQDLLIYDENNNIIYCYDYKTYKKFCIKNNIEYSKNKVERYANGLGFQQIELTSKINKTLYSISTVKGFPKSKKIFIQFNTVYLDKEKSNKIKGKWKLELNLTEQFYNREDVKYELEKHSNDIELIDANITETTMRIKYKMKNLDIIDVSNISMYVKDNFGNKYNINEIEDSIFIYKDEVSVTFPITTKEPIEHLTLYISIYNQDYTSIVLRPKK